MIINLLGTNFTIQSDEDPAYLRQILSYLEDKVQEVSSGVKTSDPLKISILAGLLLADELHKQRNQSPIIGSSNNTLNEEDELEVAEITTRLIKTIDECLS
jgi:cell division protein ZapA